MKLLGLGMDILLKLNFSVMPMDMVLGALHTRDTFVKL